MVPEGGCQISELEKLKLNTFPPRPRVWMCWKFWCNFLVSFKFSNGHGQWFGWLNCWSRSTYQLLKGAARLANSRCSRSICSSTRSASSSAWRRRWVSAPSLSHCEQMRWHLAFTLATSWYSRVLEVKRGSYLKESTYLVLIPTL